MARRIESRLSEAGYRMLGVSEIEEIILSILEKRDIRFLKAIPYLIYLHKPDIGRVYARTRYKKLFGEIVGITRKIFSYEGIETDLPSVDEKSKLNFEEFIEEFRLQRQRSERPALLLEKEKIYAERSLLLQMSQIFTKKEKHIINRLLSNKPISKTEYEYYSRKTKKKLNAILNLQDLARSLLPISPKADEGLFELKRYLESLAGKEGYTLERFSTSGNAVFLSLRGKAGEEYRTIIRQISGIKKKRFRELIKRYEEHDFR